MSILGVSNAVTGVYQHTGRTQKNTANGVSFTERTAQAQEVSDAEKLENFKKEIWNEINSMPWVSDSKLRETQKANYFSNLCSVDCAVLSVKGQSCRKYCAVLP